MKHESTTLRKTTERRMDKFREYRSEIYSDIVLKLLHIAEKARKDPELSREAIKSR